MKKIVIIPSYNEEKNIGKVIRGIRKNHRNLDVLVINDCSDDKTEEIAKYENAYVVNHVLRAGYGASLQTGYKYALHKNYDIVAYIQGTVLVETRRHAKELAAQRELADKAEASRFTDLRAHLDQEMQRLNETLEKVSQETLSRVDRAEMGLREHAARSRCRRARGTARSRWR